MLTHVTRNLADEEDSEDEKPRVRKAVTVWRARKKEEAKLKKRYEVLCNKYQRSGAYGRKLKNVIEIDGGDKQTKQEWSANAPETAGATPAAIRRLSTLDEMLESGALRIG